MKRTESGIHELVLVAGAFNRMKESNYGGHKENPRRKQDDKI